jgi:hypothetical protein
MNIVKNSAPTNPPNREEAKAADNARAACPCFDIGKPSNTVAWLDDDPGIPINTDAKVSEVGTTAIRPIINANPMIGSRPKIKGNIKERPAIPPRPGKIPTDRPRTTPKPRNIKTSGCRMRTIALASASRATLIISI